MTTTDTLEMRMTRVLPATPRSRCSTPTPTPRSRRSGSPSSTRRRGSWRSRSTCGSAASRSPCGGPDRDTLFREEQTFLVIERPPRRLVTESTGSSPDGLTMTTRVDITFEAQGDGTLMTIVQSGFPAVEVRDFFTQKVWVGGALDRIEAFLVRA